MNNHLTVVDAPSQWNSRTSSGRATGEPANVCFVTEIDLDRKLGGAITNDLKTHNCLQKIVEVDTIYLQRQRYRSDWLALLVFLGQICRSVTKRHSAYFSRGLLASFALILLRPIHSKAVIHNALSVPFPSIEAGYARRNKLSGFVWLSLMRFLERVITLHADAIVVAADSYAAQLLKNGVQKSKVHVVPFYVEDEFFEQPIRSRARQVFRFCYIGGFHPYHMLLPIIEAFQYLCVSNDKVELCLVGEGPLRHDIENEVSRRKLTQKIKFLGQIPHASIPHFLAEVDSLIVPTNYGISTNLLEGAAAGKAIITLRRRGDVTLEYYFRHGKEILYVEGESPLEIVKTMKLILEDKLRNTLSLGARRAAMQFFSEDVCMRQLRTLLRKTSKLSSNLGFVSSQQI